MKVLDVSSEVSEGRLPLSLPLPNVNASLGRSRLSFLLTRSIRAARVVARTGALSIPRSTAADIAGLFFIVRSTPGFATTLPANACLTRAVGRVRGGG